jgi:hypothetical protein
MASFSQGVTTQIVKAPRWPVNAALSAAVVSVALIAGALMLEGRDSLASAVAGYVIGAIAGPAFVQLYRHRRKQRNQSPWFNPSAALDRLSAAAMTAGLISGAVHAFFIATELAK